MNIITYKLEENTISDGNMEGDLLFILHKLTIGKNYKFRKKEEMSKVDGRCSFFVQFNRWNQYPSGLFASNCIVLWEGHLFSVCFWAL